MIPDGVSVTLVEPKYPVNAGHIARLLRNFRVRKLYLVKPSFDFSVAAVYASHAADVLDDAVVTTMEEVRKQNELLIATTAVRATRKSNIVRRMVRPEELRPLLMSAKSSSLVFGRDSTGLTTKELAMCDATTTIETSREYRSLNIGHAVAIILYLASRGGRPTLKKQTRTAREVFARSLYELGGASGYNEKKVGSLLGAGKRLAASSKMSDEELNLITGVMRKARVALGDGQAGSKT